MKKGISILKTLVSILVFLSLLGAGSFLFVRNEIRTPKDPEGEEVIFGISKGEGVFSVAERLEKKGIIKERYLFLISLVENNGWQNLQAGAYRLSPAMTIPEIAGKLKKGETADIKVTIPEGFSLEEVEEKLNETLEKNFDLSGETVGKYEGDYDFLSEVPSSLSVEGFLFPDTYFMSPLVEKDEVVGKLLSGFEMKPFPLISKEDKDVFETVVMASLIEKEVKTLEEKRIVSGVLWKRLEKDMLLQVDATITYLTGRKTTAITDAEKRINSPYNTYMYEGLPKGPICNPGLESIKAALDPLETDYLFYLTTPEGQLIPSKTLEEHQAAKEKYLR